MYFTIISTVQTFHAFDVSNEFIWCDVSGWSRGQAVRSIRWGWTTSCRSWDSTMPGLQFPSGCRGEWWTLWIKFCPFSLRNLAWHCRMRKRRKVKETKTSINSKHFNVLISAIWSHRCEFPYFLPCLKPLDLLQTTVQNTQTHESLLYCVNIHALVHMAIALGRLKVFYFYILIYRSHRHWIAAAECHLDF